MDRMYIHPLITYQWMDQMNFIFNGLDGIFLKNIQWICMD